MKNTLQIGHSSGSFRNLTLALLVLTLALQVAKASGFTFGMKYSGNMTPPILTLIVPTTPNTGCSGNTIAVGAELQAVNGRNVGIQMLCGTPNAIGFWTDTNRANFLGAAPAGSFDIRSVCPSGMAVTQVTLDIEGLALSCAELRADLSTGVTSVGLAEVANQSVITNDNAPLTHSSCLGGSNGFIRTPDRFVQAVHPTFAADGSISGLLALCNSVANGVFSGFTLPTVLASTLGQQAIQHASHPDQFTIELFEFGALPNVPVVVDILVNNLPEIPLQQDFSGLPLNAPCQAVFLPLSDGQQLFRGFKCTLSGQVFASTGKFVLGTLSYTPRVGTENGASLPILTVSVENVLFDGPFLGATGVQGNTAAFPVSVN